MKKYQPILIVSALAMLLSGCATERAKYHVFHDNSTNYRHAKITQPLSIPQGYSSSKFEQYYVVPNPQMASNLQPVNLLPPDLHPNKIPKKHSFW